jgi:hypothetical protein
MLKFKIIVEFEVDVAEGTSENDAAMCAETLDAVFNATVKANRLPGIVRTALLEEQIRNKSSRKEAN